MKLSRKELAKIGIISGKDAEIFIAAMKEAELNPIPNEELIKLKDNYNQIMAKANLNNQL